MPPLTDVDGLAVRLTLVLAGAPEPLQAAKTIVVTSTQDVQASNKPAPAGSLREAVELLARGQ